MRKGNRQIIENALLADCSWSDTKEKGGKHISAELHGGEQEIMLMSMQNLSTFRTCRLLIDDGYSGVGVFQPPRFSKMLAEIEAGHVEVR